MTDDKKMHCVQNIGNLNDEKYDTKIIEYEIRTDSPIFGKSSFGPYELMHWDTIMKEPGKVQKLILKIKEAQPIQITYKEDFSKGAYYHGGGVADEIVAFASLYLRQRFKLESKVRENDRPERISLTMKWIDQDLVLGNRKISELSEGLELLVNLDEKYHLKYILAVRLYQKSLFLIENDPDIAYLNLISAIETLCRDYPLDPMPNIEEIYPDLTILINQIEDEELRKSIEKEILTKERFIGRRFREFILHYIKEDFWEYQNRPEMGKIKPEQLRSYLGKIYAQRSKTLHEGKPFPAIIFNPPIAGEEICFAKEYGSLGKIWTHGEYIPNLHFFERLVNHVLINFLVRNQKN